LVFVLSCSLSRATSKSTMDDKYQVFDVNDGDIGTANLSLTPHNPRNTKGSVQHPRTNPFRKQPTAYPNPPPGNATHSAELASNGALRRATPARAVFKDLTTAHSSITSGAARSTRSKPSSTYDLSEIEDENSIPLQALGSDTHKVNIIIDLPIPPPAALVDGQLTHMSDRKRDGRKLAHEQCREEPHSETSHQRAVQSKASKPFNKIDFFPVANPENWPFRNSGKKKDKRVSAANQQSSGEHPFIQGPNLDKDQSGTSRFDSRDSRNELEAFKEIMPFQSIQSIGIGSNAAAQLPELPIPSPGFCRGSNHHGSPYESSLPEVDTIGDIVKCYAGSNDDFSEPELPPAKQHNGINGYLSGGESYNAYRSNYQLSAREERKQERQQRATKLQNFNPPPRSGLPQSPSFATQEPGPSSSQAMGTYPSYGDTHDLLEISHQHEHWTMPKSTAMPRSDALTDLRSDVDDSYKKYAHPFHSDYDPHIVVTKPLDDITQQSTNNKRDHRDLERDISKALRRASNNSCYSNGSFDSFVNQHVNQGGKTTNAISVGELQRLKVGESFPSRPETVESYAPDTSFYNSAAVASDWISKENQREVRIPIIRNGAQAAAPPPALLHSRPYLNLSSGRGDAATTEGDWETEVTSEVEFIGGMVNRAGSSIANYSDSEAAGSSFQEVDEFGSRERILQHPADTQNTQYAGYRVRNLKDTNQPVILPSHRNHSINGYLANSYRNMPSANYTYYNPAPMPDPHRHPFNSSPPEVMEPTAQNSARDARRGQVGRESNRYQSSPLTFHTTMVSDITEASNESPYLSRPAPVAEGFRNNSSWDDASFQTDSQREAELRTRKEVTSFGLITDLAQGKHVEGYNDDGSQVTEPEEARYKLSGAPDAHPEYLNDGPIDGFRVKQTREEPGKKRFAKRPPGGLLRDIQARADAKLHRKSDRRVMKKKDFMRPHSIPDGMETLRSAGSHDSQVFTYRQPTAPPRRDSTLALYHPDQFATDPTHVFTQEELEVRHAAKSRQLGTRRNSSISQPLQPSDGLLGRSSDDEGSRRQIAGYPRLINGEEASATGSLRVKKERLGLIVLILCNLFFPMLFLYCWGYLDTIMWWYTNGEATKFGKGQKRWATLLASIWLVLFVLGVLGGVTYAIANHYRK